MIARSHSDWPRLRRMTAPADSRMPLVAMLMVTGCVFLLYAGTFASMVVVWDSSTFAHGFVVLPVSAILIWRRREALSAAAMKPSSAGFGFLAVAVFCWLISSQADAQAGQHLAFIAMIVTGIWAVLGSRNARAIRFPLLFAFFSVPIGEFLIPLLMAWTAEFTVWALNVTGIPVYLEAYVFTLPSGTFEVAEACSGIRYFLVAVVVATLFAHERFRSPTRFILFVLGVAAGSIVANGIRAYLIVLIAHASEMKIATGPDHVYFGWFVFVGLILVSFWVGNLFSDTATSGRIPNRCDDSTAPHKAHGRTAFFALAGTVAIIALGPLGQQVARSAPVDDSTILALPRAIEPWSGPSRAEFAYRPSFTGEFEATHAGYSSADGGVDVHVIYFAEQSQGSELVSEGNRIYDELWRLLRRLETESIPAHGGTMQVNTLVVTDGRQDILLWYWYDVGGHLMTSDIATKAYNAIRGVLGQNDGAAAVILATPASAYGDHRDSALLEEFLDDHLAAMSACLRSVSQESVSCTDQL